MLIGISLENPMFLENFIQEQGKIAVEYEPELFFRAEEQIRDSYVKIFGIDFPVNVVFCAIFAKMEKLAFDKFIILC